jgi:hypothetical protein
MIQKRTNKKATSIWNPPKSVFCINTTPLMIESPSLSNMYILLTIYKSKRFQNNTNNFTIFKDANALPLILLYCYNEQPNIINKGV